MARSVRANAIQTKALRANSTFRDRSQAELNGATRAWSLYLASMRKLSKTLGILATAFIFAAPALADEIVQRPIVVELFTSQGCNSCPPADALLAKLAQRQDVLA